MNQNIEGKHTANKIQVQKKGQNEFYWVYPILNNTILLRLIDHSYYNKINLVARVPFFPVRKNRQRPGGQKRLNNVT